MTVVWAVLLPTVAAWASVEAIRTAPTALANVRVRRRLAATGAVDGGTVGTRAVSNRDASGRRRGRPLRDLDDGTLIGKGPRGRPSPLLVHPQLRRLVEDRRRRHRDRAVPERLDRIVRRLRTGETLPAAIVGVGVDDDLLGTLAADIGRGRPLVASVARWRDEDASPNRRLASVALELTADAGGASARVLDGVAESLRDRVALDREVAALTSQSRASAVLLVLAPLAFALLAGSVDRRILSTLFGTPVGWVCLVVGLTLDALGALWMARLVGRHR